MKEFPEGPVVRTWHFNCCGPGSIPDWGTKIPQVKGMEKKKNENMNIIADSTDI